MHQQRKYRVIDITLSLMVCLFISAAIVSCEETCYDGKLNNRETDVDCGGPCVPCDTSGGTCYDGILNQGEEDIDCGGPCNACITDTSVFAPNFVCNGTGGSSYFPLTVGNYWIYAMPSSQWFQWSISETTQLNNGETYFHVITTGSFGTVHDYYREDAGNVYQWNSNLSIEEVYIPASPTAGYQWTTSTADSIIVDATSASLSSQNGCTYDGLLQITSYTGGNASTSYFKQGLGMVELTTVSAVLDSAVVY